MISQDIIADYDVIKAKLTEEELAYAEEIIAEHLNETCDCDLPSCDDYNAHEYKGYCFAGEFVEGCISAEDFIYRIKDAFGNK